jgi:hypothetical protein
MEEGKEKTIVKTDIPEKKTSPPPPVPKPKPKSYWNHRVMKRTYDDEVELGIYEVYYTDDEVTGFTKHPVKLVAEDIDSLKWSLNQMLECFEKEVLYYDELDKLISLRQKLIKSEESGFVELNDDFLKRMNKDVQ